jgi:hypothetical protein
MVQRLSTRKHACLVSLFESYEENKVLLMQSQASYATELDD